MCVCVCVPHDSLLTCLQKYPLRVADVVRFWQQYRLDIETQNKGLPQAGAESRMRTVQQSSLVLLNELFATALPAFASDMNNLLAEACAQQKAVLDDEVDHILADLYTWIEVSGCAVYCTIDLSHAFSHSLPKGDERSRWRRQTGCALAQIRSLAGDV